MTCYVDEARLPFRRLVMCHLVADTEEELHAMAARIGLTRPWHQAPPKARFSHYDVSKTMRALAIQAGAVPVTTRQLGVMLRRHRMEGRLGDPAEAEAWLRTSWSPTEGA